MKKVKLTVNGVQREVMVSPDFVLLDFLREELHLTGTKQSCDRKGQCGTCTVIVDGRAILSCVKKMIDLEGADVITVEGLGTPDNPHLIQEAFVLAGAIQCGFCTPGMIMATKVLLDRNPNPSIPEIKKGLERNLCRCTGYTKIIDAVKLAGRFLRGETTPEKIRSNLKPDMIGESHPRPSSMLKACGLAEFSADVMPENALELAAVHSTEFHAVIKNIDATEAKKMPGVVGVMTAADIIGTNRINQEMVVDRPLLCEDKVRTYGDAVAIVAAETREQARAAATAVKVEYELLPVMMTPEESLAEGAYQIHPHSSNLYSVQPLIKGDATKALSESSALVSAEFSTQMNYQAPLEPEASIAYFKGEGEDARMIVVGRSVGIHISADDLQEAVGWENLEYKEAYCGGQFGIKPHVTSEGIAAAAASHFKRAVRYIPSLRESMLLNSKRHPFSMKVQLGSNGKGFLTGYTNDFAVNKGAYFVFTPDTRALHMLSGVYHIPNVQGLAKLVYTNNAFGGSARGPGATQVTFALESAMDMLAEKMGIDPLEFRKMNSLKVGQTTSTGAEVKEWPFPELCDSIRPHYDRAVRDAAATEGGPIKRGVGLGCNAYGIGAAGEKAELYVEVDPDDGITIYAAVADPGEGNDSMLTQIAAHILGLPMGKVRLYTRDTEKTVNTGWAAGSRMTYMAGGALVNALEKLQQAMKEAGTKTCDGLKKAGKPTRYEGKKQLAGSYKIDPRTGQGNSYDSTAHNIQMAEVEVNTETGEVRIIRMTAAVDCGPVINPKNLEGQVEGGMDMGVGYALREEYIHGQTKDWLTFKFPRIKSSFEVEIIVRETPRTNGTLGSTGIGEITMVSTAPAVINAISNACGVRIYDLPATPEKIKSALAACGEKNG
ncbi:aldehyde oxidase and xanthine dehydrogenase, molybdopterin binding domain protein [delta proteobacterium NaphS2]|nr:aldehyde oxidase and xanthine dehydrogenase, molybdopterin binding domain protein [delta proteobacterium NaphS2]